MIYLVTWDLNQEKPNYAQARATFLERLEKLENHKDPGLDSVRFVSSMSSASEVSDYLRTALDTNDRLVVTTMRRGEYHGWLNKATWEWINVRL